MHQMGYFPLGLGESAKGLALTAILFLGPLFEAGVVEGGWKDWVCLRGLDSVLRSWIGWRNIVAVRPFQRSYEGKLDLTDGRVLSRKKCSFAPPPSLSSSSPAPPTPPSFFLSPSSSASPTFTISTSSASPTHTLPCSQLSCDQSYNSRILPFLVVMRRSCTSAPAAC